jgi:hypothetical protein
MKQTVKEIYTILVLIANLIFRRRHYRLTFKAECEGTPDNPCLVKLWYYDFKHWGFDKHNLLMVSGADKLCEMYAQGGNEATVEIVATRSQKQLNTEDYDHYEADEPPKYFNSWEKVVYGRNYHSIGQEKQRNFWICPATLFVLGRYPKHIYIKRNVK